VELNLLIEQRGEERGKRCDRDVSTFVLNSERGGELGSVASRFVNLVASLKFEFTRRRAGRREHQAEFAAVDLGLRPAERVENIDEAYIVRVLDLYDSDGVAGLRGVDSEAIVVGRVRGREKENKDECDAAQR